MWLLFMIVLTTSNDFIAYEQGRFKNEEDCYAMKIMLDREFRESNIQLTCIPWTPGEK